MIKRSPLNFNSLRGGWIRIALCLPAEFAEYAEFEEEDLEVRAGTPADDLEGRSAGIHHLDRQKYDIPL